MNIYTYIMYHIFTNNSYYNCTSWHASMQQSAPLASFFFFFFFFSKRIYQSQGPVLPVIYIVHCYISSDRVMVIIIVRIVTMVNILSYKSRGTLFEGIVSVDKRFCSSYTLLTRAYFVSLYSHYSYILYSLYPD